VKKNLFLILPLVFLLFTVSPLVYAEEELIVDGNSSEWSDDRIGINVNQVYVSEVIPVDVEALFDDIPALTEASLTEYTGIISCWCYAAYGNNVNGHGHFV